MGDDQKDADIEALQTRYEEVRSLYEERQAEIDQKGESSRQLFRYSLLGLAAVTSILVAKPQELAQLLNTPTPVMNSLGRTITSDVLIAYGIIAYALGMFGLIAKSQWVSSPPSKLITEPDLSELESEREHLKQRIEAYEDVLTSGTQMSKYQNALSAMDLVLLSLGMFCILVVGYASATGEEVSTLFVSAILLAYSVPAFYFSRQKE